MIDIPQVVTNARDARDALRAARTLVADQDAFLAQVVQLALQSETLELLEQTVTSLYRLALEQHDPFLPDVADAVLCWIEHVQAQPDTAALPKGGIAALQ